MHQRQNLSTKSYSCDPPFIERGTTRAKEILTQGEEKSEKLDEIEHSSCICLPFEHDQNKRELLTFFSGWKSRAKTTAIDLFVVSGPQQNVSKTTWELNSPHNFVFAINLIVMS